MFHEWSDDQKALRDAVSLWAQPLGEDSVAADHRAEFSRSKWQQVSKSGIFRLPFPETFGGLDQDLPTTMYVLEALGYECEDAGLNFAIATHMISVGIPLLKFGSYEQKQRYLVGVCDGVTIGAHAITEPSSGSDVTNMSTIAERGDGEFILSGHKTFISNGPIADIFVIYAITDKNRGTVGGITSFIVERGMEGFAIGEPMQKMGLRTAPLCDLYFNDCRVPVENVIGKVGQGFVIFDYVMKWEISCSFIINVGEMQKRFEKCLNYAKSRQQFGKSIGSFQSISNKIVDMKIGVEISRNWLYRTALRFERKKNVTTDIAIAKLLTSEYNLSSALSAMRVFGGIGYMTEQGIEKDVRNAIGGLTYSGTSEMQRNRIAAMLGL